jgi:radical SAM protein with 4Fe4S-binding SPASM domain
LKQLEKPSIYDIVSDELYELDEEAFDLLKKTSDVQGYVFNAAESEFLDYCLSNGILTDIAVHVKHPAVRQSPIASLRYLELQVTDRCNLKCRHCYIGKPLNKELPIDHIRMILAEFEDMQGLRLLITGGEPLMHRNFEKINEMLPDFAFRKILFTNGLLLNRELIRRLNVHEIQFSVDGLEDGHEALRGNGTYNAVIKRIEDALSEGIAVSIATMIHKENLDEFDEMDKLFRRMNIKDWTVDVPCVSGNLTDNDFLRVSPEIAGKYMNYGFGDGLHGGGEGYGCGLHLASVLPDGNIAKCAFYSNSPAGNISEGLETVWSRIIPVRLGDLECSDMACSVIDFCRGGCRFRAECSEGQLKKDLYKCHAYDIIKSDGHEAL